MRCYRNALRACAQFEALESRQLLSVTPQLVADVNTEQSSFPRDFVEFDGRLFYTAEDAQHGRELWSSDGTPEGTQLVKNIRPGAGDAKIAGLVVSGDWLYFAADDGTHGRELWRTDGTAEGTQLFREFNAGLASGLPSSPEMIDVSGTLFLKAGNAAPMLWKSDGTEAGTVPLVSQNNTKSYLTAVGDLLYFTKWVDRNNSELWKSDGTPEGTGLVKGFYSGLLSGPDLQELTAFDGQLFLIAQDAIWKSDGTALGTVEVDSVSPYDLLSSHSLEVAGEKLYFAAKRDIYYNDIWVVDSASSPAAPIHIPTNLSLHHDDRITAVGDWLYFRGDVAESSALWRTDGTTEGTEYVANFWENGRRLKLDDLTGFGDELFFTTSLGGSAPDLWRSDGTPEGTARWRAPIAPPGFAENIELGVAGGKLFFTANGGGTGLELWRTDGTDNGTIPLTDLSNAATDSSTPKDFVSTATHVFFTAENGFGRQLFSTAGPSGPVTQLTPSMSGLTGAQVEQLTPVGNLLYFVAVDEDGRYLGVSDGTLAGTQRLDWPFAADQIEVSGVTEFGGGVTFLVNDATLGVMIGHAEAGAIEIIDSLGTNVTVSTTDQAIVWQGNYYFIAAQGDKEIWRTDGTAAGTYPLSDLVPDLAPYSYGFTATNNALYYISAETEETPSRLWHTDGTPAGTFAYSDLQAPLQLLAAGDNLFFSIRTPNSPVGPLWSTDGTLAGTREVGQYFEPGIGGWYGDRALTATELDGSLYFFGPGSPGLATFALWQSDGTPGGTQRVVDLPGTWPTSRWSITTEGGKLFLYAANHLYESDGTAYGTRKLFGGLGGPNASEIRTDGLAGNLTLHDGDLYFEGSADEVGSEPFSVSTTLPNASIVSRRLFYNDSAFDNNDASLNGNDKFAIAKDKQAYLPGNGPSTFANVSSYSRGINGIAIDVLDLPDNVMGPLVTLDDFEFRIGRTDELGSWTEAPAPNQIGFVQTTFGWQILLSWESGTITNTWLEVKLLANERTGLAEPDVFYFGSRIGDAGSGSVAAAVTSAADEVAARNAASFGVTIANPYDFNRDGIVSANDAMIARNHAGFLKMLDLTGPIGEITPQAAVPAADRAALTALAFEQWRQFGEDDTDTESDDALLDELIGTRKRR